MLDRVRNESGVGELSERALAERIGAAAPAIDRAAETELCRRLAPRVRLYGLRHLRDPHAASDLVQQTLLLVLERVRAGGLRDPERIVSFVFGSCRRIMLDSKRTHARREALLQRFAHDVPVVEDTFAPQLDRERMLACLEALSERDRAVLVLTFYEDRQAGAVACELALSEANVRVIRHRALERLRACVLGKGAMR